MKCEWVRENIMLYIYNELADDARYELEQHLARCAECAAELKAARKLHTTLSQFRWRSPRRICWRLPACVCRKRWRLRRRAAFWSRFIFDPAAWLHQIRFSPGTGGGDFHRGLRRRHWRHCTRCSASGPRS